MKIKEIFKDTSCKCKECVDMCKNNRPCWGTPEEIKAIINNGYGDRLMLDYAAEGGVEYFVLCPALVGYEQTSAPTWPVGACAFFRDNLCELHQMNLKPAEGRLISCKNTNEECQQLHRQIAKTWDNDEAQKLVRQWQEWLRNKRFGGKA